MDDSSKDMRKEVGLGTCNCCDYFLIIDETVVLIEETRLRQQIKNLENDYKYLSKTDKEKFIDERILRENRLKAFGSMLVLSHLVAKSTEASELLGTKKYKFWLVVSDESESQDTIFFDNYKRRFVNDLKSALSGQIVDDVEIVPSKEVFVRKLPRQSPFYQTP